LKEPEKMSTHHDPSQTPFVPNDHTNEPGPYHLPEAESEAEAGASIDQARRRDIRSLLSFAFGRSTRTVSALLVVSSLLVGLNMSLASSNDPRQLLHRDSFDRGSGGEWGASSSGQRWHHQKERHFY